MLPRRRRLFSLVISTPERFGGTGGVVSADMISSRGGDNLHHVDLGNHGFLTSERFYSNKCPREAECGSSCCWCCSFWWSSLAPSATRPLLRFRTGCRGSTRDGRRCCSGWRTRQ